MQQKFIQKQMMNQQLSVTQQRSLEILKMSETELQEAIRELCRQNPFVEYRQSIDFNEWIEEGFSAPASWKSDLYKQLYTGSEPFDPRLCGYIIESLNENGLFTDSEEESAAYLNCTPDQWKEALHTIQKLDPAGIAARSQKECILLQLSRRKEWFAYRLLKTYGSSRKLPSWKEMAEKENVSLQTVKNALATIRTCSLHPDLGEDAEKKEVLIPDLSIDCENGEVVIEPVKYGQLQVLTISEKNETLKKYFQEANFFIDAINKRNQTLLILANEIISVQKNHFLFHDELEACTLQEIAQKSGFHESTVSRTLSNKYYLFEGTIYPLKGLFVSKTRGGTSQDSVLKAIGTLISQEDPHKPFSDQQLCNQLEDLGIYVSRRAINKYRKVLGIENANKRKARNK